MRVALLQEYFVPHAPGGAEWSTLALAEQLAARGLSVSVVTLDLADDTTRAAVAETDERLRARGVRVCRVPFPKKMRGTPQVFPPHVFGNPVTQAYLAWSLPQALSRWAPDVLHAQSLDMLVPAWRYARHHALPVLFTVRDYRALCPVATCLQRQELPPRRCDRAQFRACSGEYLQTYGVTLSPAAKLRYRLRREIEWSMRGRYAAAFRELDAAVFVSDAVRRIHAEAGFTGRRAAVVHNLPTEPASTADPETLRRRFALSGRMVLFIGRWSLGKGAADLAHAWPLVRAACPDATLVVVGREEAPWLGPRDGVLFTGALPHEEAMGLLQLANVFALPSRWPEPYARTVLEAMASAKPVVATRVGGNGEQVVDGVTGFLVDRGDTRAFADRVNDLLSNSDRARQIGEAGRARLHGELAASAQLDRLTALYDTVAAEKRRRPLRLCAPVLSLTENTVQGGGFFHVKNLQALADRGVSCLLPLAFRTDFEPRPNWDVRAIPIHRTYRLGAILSNALFFAAVLWLRFVRRERFDLLRIGDLYHLGPGLICAARLCDVPTVGVIHHIDHERRLENAIVGWTARRLNGLLVPSRASANDVVRTFDVEAWRVHQIVEGATRFSGGPTTAVDAKRRLGLPDGDLIGFVGALEERKNVGFLLEATARVVRTRPRTHLLIVGDGAQRIALEQTVLRLGLREHVTFAGRLFEAEKAAAFRAMDVFAFPSRNEGFGLAVAEAMAAGVAPMVSDKGSLPEVVQHESTGLVVSIDDPAKWEAALRRLLDDADLRQRLGDAARAHAETQFTWSASAAQTEQAFRQVLSAKRQRALGVLLNSGDSLATMRQEGQAERFVGHYLRRYAEAFDRVEVFSYGDDRAQPYANAYFVPGRPRWKGLAYAAAWPFLHRRRLRHLRLLRVMQTGAALPAVLARVLFGVPFVVTYGYRYGDFMRMNGRPWYGWYLDQLERVALRLADRVIVTTPALAAHVRRFAREEKIRLLPNGVDLAQFKPRQSPRHDKKKAVLFVGRLTRQKNLPLLVDALSPLRERVRLICVGAGEMESALREQAARAGLELEAPGVVPHEELPRWHHRADVFVLPSRMEGHPKALLEAMASGLPCVGVDAPGIRDVLTHEQSGLLVAPTAEAVRGAVERVLGDPNLAAALGRQARETASAKYDLHRLLDGEIALLREADGGAKPCRAS